MYEHIDMKKTGILLKYRIEKAGYTVKDIQKILQLSCPQPIYRWFKGMILPSVDHLYVLSRLLKVHVMYENQRLQKENKSLKELLEKAYDFMKQFVIDVVNLLEKFMESVRKVMERLSPKTK